MKLKNTINEGPMGDAIRSKAEKAIEQADRSIGNISIPNAKKWMEPNQYRALVKAIQSWIEFYKTME